ncbi:MAG TPA: hypothetical protein VIG08_12760 [Gemmatimonadales bacterium]|jgi:hypothetical protein
MKTEQKKPEIPRADAIRGTTMQWTWTEGPTKGSVHEHVFHGDGTVEWREVGGKASGKSSEGDAHTPAHADRVPYGSFEVGPETYAVSYRAGSGFTLTVVFNLRTEELVGFASNNESWFPLRGTCRRVR